MKKIISFIMVISIFSSCKIEKNADSQLTTTESNIEHVCIPLTDAQIIGLYNTLTTVQTRAVVLVSSLEEFKSYLNTSLVAVCFTATWSGPCKMYKPIYHKVSEKYTASVCRFLEVDVDESPELRAAGTDAGILVLRLCRLGQQQAARPATGKGKDPCQCPQRDGDAAAPDLGDQRRNFRGRHRHAQERRLPLRARRRAVRAAVNLGGAGLL